MLKEFILREDISLSPAARGLLACMLCVHKGAPASRKQIDELAAGLHQSKPVTRRVLEEWQQSGLIESVPREGGGEDKSKIEYELTHKLLLKFAARAEGDVGATIEYVLDPANPLLSIRPPTIQASPEGAAATPEEMAAERKRTAKKGFREAAGGITRLLLAVLLVHADSWGVVQGVGSAKLKRLTGLSSEQLKAQLFKLNHLGYILHKVQGLSGSVLLGRREAIYSLNLHHPSLPGCEAAGSVVRLLVDAKSYGSEMTEAGCIMHCADELRGGGFSFYPAQQAFLGVRGDCRHLARFFLYQSRLSGGVMVLPAALQMLLDGYASELLSRHWDRLSSEALFDDEDILLRATEDFTPKAPEKPIELKWGGRFLYDVAFAMACRVKRLLPDLDGYDLSSCDFRLLPLLIPTTFMGFRAILVRPKLNPGGGQFLTLRFNGGVLERISSARLDELDWRREMLLQEFHALKRFGYGDKSL